MSANGDTLPKSRTTSDLTSDTPAIDRRRRIPSTPNLSHTARKSPGKLFTSQHSGYQFCLVDAFPEESDLNKDIIYILPTGKYKVLSLVAKNNAQGNPIAANTTVKEGELPSKLTEDVDFESALSNPFFQREILLHLANREHISYDIMQDWLFVLNELCLQLNQVKHLFKSGDKLNKFNARLARIGIFYEEGHYEFKSSKNALTAIEYSNYVYSESSLIEVALDPSKKVEREREQKIKELYNAQFQLEADIEISWKEDIGEQKQGLEQAIKRVADFHGEHWGTVWQREQEGNEQVAQDLKNQQDPEFAQTLHAIKDYEEEQQRLQEENKKNQEELAAKRAQQQKEVGEVTRLEKDLEGIGRERMDIVRQQREASEKEEQLKAEIAKQHVLMQQKEEEQRKKEQEIKILSSYSDKLSDISTRSKTFNRDNENLQEELAELERDEAKLEEIQKQLRKEEDELTKLQARKEEFKQESAQRKQQLDKEEAEQTKQETELKVKEGSLKERREAIEKRKKQLNEMEQSQKIEIAYVKDSTEEKTFSSTLSKLIEKVESQLNSYNKKNRFVRWLYDADKLFEILNSYKDQLKNNPQNFEAIYNNLKKDLKKFQEKNNKSWFFKVEDKPISELLTHSGELHNFFDLNIKLKKDEVALKTEEGQLEKTTLAVQQQRQTLDAETSRITLADAETLVAKESEILVQRDFCKKEESKIAAIEKRRTEYPSKQASLDKELKGIKSDITSAAEAFNEAVTARRGIESSITVLSVAEAEHHERGMAAACEEKEKEVGDRVRVLTIENEEVDRYQKRAAHSVEEGEKALKALPAEKMALQQRMEQNKTKQATKEAEKKELTRSVISLALEIEKLEKDSQEIAKAMNISKSKLEHRLEERRLQEEQAQQARISAWEQKAYCAPTVTKSPAAFAAGISLMEIDLEKEKAVSAEQEELGARPRISIEDQKAFEDSIKEGKPQKTMEPKPSMDDFDFTLDEEPSMVDSGVRAEEPERVIDDLVTRHETLAADIGEKKSGLEEDLAAQQQKLKEQEKLLQAAQSAQKNAEPTSVADTLKGIFRFGFLGATLGSLPKEQSGVEPDPRVSQKAK